MFLSCYLQWKFASSVAKQPDMMPTWSVCEGGENLWNVKAQIKPFYFWKKKNILAKVTNYKHLPQNVSPCHFKSENPWGFYSNHWVLPPGPSSYLWQTVLTMLFTLFAHSSATIIRDHSVKQSNLVAMQQEQLLLWETCCWPHK